MFSLTEKQNFWVNLILGFAMAVLFLGALKNFILTFAFMNILSMLIYGVLAYLSGNALMKIYRTKAYPFNRRRKPIRRNW